MSIIEAVVAVILAAIGGSGIGSFITLKAQNKKTFAEASKLEAEMDSVTIGSLIETIKALRGELDALKDEVKTLRSEKQDCSSKIAVLEDERFELRKMMGIMQQEILDTRAGITILIQQLKREGIEPQWMPGTGPLFPQETDIRKRL